MFSRQLYGHIHYAENLNSLIKPFIAIKRSRLVDNRINLASLRGDKKRFHLIGFAKIFEKKALRPGSFGSGRLPNAGFD
jgi:hypothetical protein